MKVIFPLEYWILITYLNNVKLITLWRAMPSEKFRISGSIPNSIHIISIVGFHYSANEISKCFACVESFWKCCDTFISCRTDITTRVDFFCHIRFLFFFLYSSFRCRLKYVGINRLGVYTRLTMLSIGGQSCIVYGTMVNGSLRGHHKWRITYRYKGQILDDYAPTPRDLTLSRCINILIACWCIDSKYLNSIFSWFGFLRVR